MFPGAKFICLYRHPMDVIASGIEACPWGLKGYGFEPYAAESPGNAVQALARFWSDHAAAILAAEEQFPDRCHRVRYEDLVADPEAVADGIFRFIGVPPAQGISTSCFAPERERLGPADYKIWHTSRITAGSVGRGWSVPAGADHPAGHRDRQRARRQARLRPGRRDVERGRDRARSSAIPGGRTGGPGGRRPRVDTRQMPRVFLVLGDLLQTGLFRVSDRFARRWGTFAAESFLVVATSQAAGSARWRVDLAARTVTLAEASQGDEGALCEAAWQLAGPADVWERVIRGTANLNVVLRRRELRYCDTGHGAPTTVTRIGHARRPARHHLLAVAGRPRDAAGLARLCGLTTPVRPPRPRPACPRASRPARAPACPAQDRLRMTTRPVHEKETSRHEQYEENASPGPPGPAASSGAREAPGAAADAR